MNIVKCIAAEDIAKGDLVFIRTTELGTFVYLANGREHEYCDVVNIGPVKPPRDDGPSAA